MNTLERSRARMSCNEYVADYLDRKDIQGFPTNAQIASAREEWRELQEQLMEYEAGDYVAYYDGVTC